MKESYRKGQANHPDPESCQGSREVSLRSVDRGTGRLGTELRDHTSGVPTLFREAEGNTPRSVQGELFGDPAQSSTPRMFGNSVRENRETPAVPAASSGPAGEGSSRTSSMNAAGESDGGVVPAKCPNNGGSRWRRAWREGVRPRRIWDDQACSELSVGMASAVRLPHMRKADVRFAAIIRGKSRVR